MVGQLAIPTNPVLSEAVALILSKDSETPVEDVVKKITEDHPEWSISERRVKKFSKRYLRKVAGASTDDEDTTISELSGKSGSKTSSIMQRLFSPKKKTKTAEGDTEKLESVPEPAPEVEVPLDEAKLYVDDNTSESENCECNACVIS